MCPERALRSSADVVPASFSSTGSGRDGCQKTEAGRGWPGGAYLILDRASCLVVVVSSREDRARFVVL
jgi:hypothetical protein